MNFNKLISNYYLDLSETEIQIINFIDKHQKEMESMSMTVLAKKTYTSTSSIHRLAQKLGFSGYSEFKYMINWTSKENNRNIDLESLSNKLSLLSNNFNTFDFTSFFEKINDSNNIYIITTGLSQNYQARTLQRNFLKVGIHMSILSNGQITELSSSIIEKITKNDLIIVFSFSGETPYLKEILSVPLIKNVFIASIVSNENSWLVKNSSFYLTLELSKELEEIVQFNSTFVHLAIDFIGLRYEQYVRKINRN